MTQRATPVNRTWRLLAGALVLGLFAGCQTTPVDESLPDGSAEQAWATHRDDVASVTAWNLKGKMAVRTGRKGGSATLLWEYRDNGQDIELYGPFGGGRVRIAAGPQGAILNDTRGRTIEGETADEVLYQRLGWQVPFEELEHWCRGLPGDQATRIVLDERGRMRSFREGNWDVLYEDYQQVGELVLPRKIRIDAVPGRFEIYDDDGAYLGDELNVKLILRRWWELVRES